MGAASEYAAGSPLTRLASSMLATLSPLKRGEGNAFYLIASGLTGEPTAPVMGIAGATSMNS